MPTPPASRAAHRADRLGVLSPAERLLLGSALLLVTSTFLPWFRAEAFGLSLDLSAWSADATVGTVLLLIGTTTAGVLVATRVGQGGAPAVLRSGWTWAMAGLLAAGLVAARAVAGYRGTHRAYGLWVAAGAALLLAAAGAATALRSSAGADAALRSSGGGRPPGAA